MFNLPSWCSWNICLFCFQYSLLQVSEKFQSISDMIAGKPYEQHVVSKYFAIENSSNDQEDSEVSEEDHKWKESGIIY